MALRIALRERPASLRPLRRAVLLTSAAVSRALADGERSAAAEADRRAEAEPLRAEPLREEALRVEAPRAEDDRPLPADPEEDRALAERDWRVPPLLALRPLPLRLLPLRLLALRLLALPLRLLAPRLLPPEREPDEPPRRDGRDCVLSVPAPSDEDDFADLERLELPRGLVVDISTSRRVECAGSR